LPLTSENHRLGDGVYRVALPLPFPSPPAVNCYLFEADDGLTLLDCGVDGDPQLELLARALESLGFGLDDLHRLVASHLHVDHMGMAKRIIEITGCEWVMHTSATAEIPHYNDCPSSRGARPHSRSGRSLRRGGRSLPPGSASPGLVLRGDRADASC